MTPVFLLALAAAAAVCSASSLPPFGLRVDLHEAQAGDAGRPVFITLDAIVTGVSLNVSVAWALPLQSTLCWAAKGPTGACSASKNSVRWRFTLLAGWRLAMKGKRLQNS